MTPEPRTPLSLEFSPASIEGYEDDQRPGLVVAEPSFEVPGRVFIGANPFGKRMGLHLLPEEVRRLRDHLTKLLMEKPSEAPGEPSTPIDQYIRRDDAPPVDWQERIIAAARRVRQEKPKWFLFKVEFQFGDIQGVIGRLRD